MFIMRFLIKNKEVSSDNNSIIIRVKTIVIKNKKIEVLFFINISMIYLMQS